MMDNKVYIAIKRLDSILPLLTGLKSLCKDDLNLYCKLLNSYVQLGRILSLSEIDKFADNADEALSNIASSKLIVLDEKENPSGVYPFTSQVREHEVLVNKMTVHCMCALDALAVSPMFNKQTLINSQCRVTHSKIYIEQDGTVITDCTQGIWFGINWGAASETVCAESLCMEMIFLLNKSVAQDWLDKLPETREIFDLPSAVDFAAGFFVPLAKQCKLNKQ